GRPSSKWKSTVPPRRTRSSTSARMSMASMLVARTIRHNTWTIGLYRPRSPKTRCSRGERTSSVIQQEPTKRYLLLSTAAVLMAGVASAVHAQSADLPKGAAHNIVLVHGAFVDQTSWQPVADILTKKGYNVTLVENPLTSLAADVAATRQALAKQNGKTVLVGHSWGGVGITQAGNDPKVSAIDYFSPLPP